MHEPRNLSPAGSAILQWANTATQTRHPLAASPALVTHHPSTKARGNPRKAKRGRNCALSKISGTGSQSSEAGLTRNGIRNPNAGMPVAWEDFHPTLVAPVHSANNTKERLPTSVSAKLEAFSPPRCCPQHGVAGLPRRIHFDLRRP